jgi:hypothetical protein
MSCTRSTPCLPLNFATLSATSIDYRDMLSTNMTSHDGTQFSNPVSHTITPSVQDQKPTQQDLDAKTIIATITVGAGGPFLDLYSKLTEEEIAACALSRLTARLFWADGGRYHDSFRQNEDK